MDCDFNPLSKNILSLKQIKCIMNYMIELYLVFDTLNFVKNEMFTKICLLCL